MRRSMVLAGLLLITVMLSACGRKGTVSDVTIDYGTSEIYSEEEMKSAISLILDEFSTWEGCELHSIRYGTDACDSEENVRWMNELKEGQSYTHCIEFYSDFHSPVRDAGAWEQDEEYTDWEWWLARSDDGEWELLSWGYL